MSLARSVLFSGRNTSRVLRVDPTGLTLPSFTVNKVYAIDEAPGDIVEADPTASTIILGFYQGVDTGGFLLFEQERVVDEAAFTARGTRWFLAAGGTLSITPSAVEMGVAISADELMVTGVRDSTGTSGITGIDVIDEAGDTATDVQDLDFDSDQPGGIPFASVSESPAGTALIKIDKQTDFTGLAASATSQPTGFSFVAANYRAVEIFYAIVAADSKYETGVIYLLHDVTNARTAIRVDRVSPIGFEPSVTFGVDLSGGNCRLLYTETAGQIINLHVKPRAIIAADPEAPPPP